MGGRLAPEWVDGINRNGWTASPGIAGRNHAEYAANGEVGHTTGRHIQKLRLGTPTYIEIRRLRDANFI